MRATKTAMGSIGMASWGVALAWLTALHTELGPLAGIDRAIQFGVHGWTRPWATGVMLAFTWVGAVKMVVPAVVGMLGWLLWSGRRHTAAVLSGAIGGAVVLNETLKLHFHRARPTVPWAIGDERTYSFPSGHSLFAVTLYGVLVYLALRRGVSVRRRVSVVVTALVMVVGIGLSRIYLGEHFPTDVLAGYGVGLVWVAGVAGMDRVWRGAREQQILSGDDSQKSERNG